MKYLILTHATEPFFPVVFAGQLSHAQIAAAFAPLGYQPRSAGFVEFQAAGVVRVHDRSTSLNLDPHPLDAGLLATFHRVTLGTVGVQVPKPAPTPYVAPTFPLSQAAGLTTAQKQPTPANLNDAVRFKLTDKGRAYVAELNRTHPVHSRVPLQYQPAADGWIETQLWDFANVFGPTMRMGFDQTVETAIQLRSLC